MSYCLNLRCQKPQNPSDAKFCSTCGSRLLLDNRYRAIKPISQSGFGQTFLAVDEQEASQPQCIIKQFSPQNQGTNNTEKAVELFRQEARRLWELGQHPQIPQLLAYFEGENQAGGSTASAIVQTLIKGKSLAERLKSEGVFSENEIREILKEILPVLQFIHERGVIHRDINPENIIRRCNDQKIVLVDFSAAKFTSKTALARTGTVIGSAAYTSQEQLRGKALTSSDLYSLGVTCIHLLTEIHPFELFNSLEGIWVWQDYLTNSVSPQLSKILNKMLEGAAKDRYQSAAEILKDLEPEGIIATQPQTFVQQKNLPTITQNFIPTWTCIRTFKSHLSSINAIAFSQDGQIASGSADRTVKLWDLGSNLLSTFSGHSSLIDAVTFSPDGRLIASGSWDYTIKIWDVETRKLVQTLGEHSGWIKSIAISPDSKSLISGSADKTIKIWNLETGKVAKTFEHKSAIHAVVISPDGQIMASGSADKTIKIWNLNTGELLLTFDEHSDVVDTLVFSPSAQILISGSADKTIKIWHIGKGKLLHTLNSHCDTVNSLAINNEGNLLVSGSADKTIKIWHPGSGELLHTLSGHSSAVTSVAISFKGQGNRLVIASGSQDKTIKIWQFE